MIKLSTDHIRMRGKAADEAEAIRLAAGLLIKHGNIDPGYVRPHAGARKSDRCQLMLRRCCSTWTRSS
jgi:mannitol/fructose-specific phosphotransferase system IIA component